jgi:hypothetical protein
LTTYPGHADCSIEIRHTLVTRPAFLTLGVKNTASVDADQIANLVRSAFVAAGSLLSIIDSSANLVAIHTRLGLLGEEDEPGLNSNVSAGTGAYTTGFSPNLAVLVTKKTPLGGRHNRGRMYIPWCGSASDYTEDGRLTGAKVTSVQTACNTFFTGLSTAQIPMYVLHRGPTGAGLSPTQVSALQVQQTLGTQRRRLRP